MQLRSKLAVHKEQINTERQTDIFGLYIYTTMED